MRLNVAPQVFLLGREQGSARALDLVPDHLAGIAASGVYPNIVVPFGMKAGSSPSPQQRK